MLKTEKIRDKFKLLLAQDVDFKQKLSSDSVLIRLDNEKENPEFDELELNAFLGGFYHSGFLAFKPITPAILSLLWLLNNAFVNRDVKRTAVEVDIALYLITNAFDLYKENKLNLSKKQLEIDSSAYAIQNGLTYEEAQADIDSMLNLAKRPYQMFPHDPHANELDNQKPKYDSYWMSDLIGIVHRETGLTPNQIKWELSMTECGYYVVQYWRKEGVKNIERRTDSETNIMILERIENLKVEHLESLGYTKEEIYL